MFAGVDRIGQFGDLLGHGDHFLVATLGVERISAERAATEESDRPGSENTPVVSHQRDGLPEPVEHIRRAPDDEDVVPLGTLDRGDWLSLGIDAGGLQRLSDPFGDPLGGAVAARIRDENMHGEASFG